MRNFFLFFLFTFLSISVFSQSVDLSLLKNKTPRNIGPAGMSGRVTSIDVVTSDPNVMYVGTASGGLWKSVSGGIKWEPVFDDQVTASIGSVAIQQSNPSVIWVGTGEGNPRNSLNGGYGIFKSLDGGRSWKNMGLEKTRHIHRVVIDPTNPNIVYAAAIGSPWGEHEERGVYRTKDGGKTWEKILYNNKRTGAADLVMDPKNPNKLITAMWEHKRDPWFFNSGGEGSGMYITYDGGDTWQERTSKDGLPEGELGRIGLAIAPSNPEIIYALVESKKNALYKTEDGGFNWKMVNSDENEIGNRPFYYSDIFVDPQNPNRLYSVFTYINVSDDGGKSFEELMPAYGVSNGVHPDHHAWWIHPEDGDFMMDGNDGGLNITRDRGKTWRFVANLPVAQFYHIAVDNEFPYNVYGGMQDNGSWRGPAYIWKDQGIRNSYWQEISFGDGFDVVPDRDDSRYGWSMSQQGYVSRYDHITGNNYLVRPTHPNPEVELRFNWNSAINIDPFDNNTIYFGSQFVHKSTDKGLTWKIISPDLTTNDPEKQKQQDSGGLTIDATGAENYTTILVIEPSPVEENVIWVGTDDGKVHITKNGGNSWEDISNISGLPRGSWVTQIKASTKNKGEALLVANDYRRFNYKAYAFKTSNYGKTWTRIVDENDTKSYALSILQDPVEKKLMFLGTDDGLYISFDAAKNWQKYTNGFPTVSVKDMVIHPRENDLVLGTFGRAAWVLDDVKPFREIAKDPSVLNKKLELFEPPTAYHTANQQPTGSRFGADATYHGENREGGARISYFIQIPEKKEKDTLEEVSAKKKFKKNTPLRDQEGESPNVQEIGKDSLAEIEKNETKWDSIHLKIYEDNRQIRHLKEKAPDSTGMYVMKWNLDEKGVQNPSRTINELKNEPGGIKVLPGAYRLVMEFGDQTSEEIIKVEPDPRLDNSMENSREIYNSLKGLNDMTQLAANAVEQLVQSKNTAEGLKEKINKTESLKEQYKEQMTETDTIVKKIDELLALYLGEIDKRQGITRNREMTVMNRIYLASGYISSRQNGITETEEILMKQAKDELNSALEKTNVFFNKDWPEYRVEMEKIDIPVFKEIKQFRLE
ncbi:hypothetical protein [Gramella sp. AN32]|uniref:Sortilin N-terminal domain-containing protein n=1 Tax=Christiangramia antarctica TaxID=2058158 RepID=A0ABW5XC12_9FLAO|nr:hypothetical protein [Gramella sp. AN32]MCM4156552.1 hypothetical protein [Gramella sp. AN32]